MELCLTGGSPALGTKFSGLAHDVKGFRRDGADERQKTGAMREPLRIALKAGAVRDLIPADCV